MSIVEGGKGREGVLDFRDNELSLVTTPIPPPLNLLGLPYAHWAVIECFVSLMQSTFFCSLSAIIEINSHWNCITSIMYFLLIRIVLLGMG
jgi:hypothetical protein